MRPASLEDAGRQVERWRRVMILSHARPDGDALGAMAALRIALAAKGGEPHAFVYEKIPPRYTFLERLTPFELWPPEPPADSGFDGIVILDTCSWSQLEPPAAFLRSSSLPKVVVDHHATRDDLAINGTDDLLAADVTSASTCGLVYAWCETMGWPIDAAMAEALWIGMVTDTGWFRFSNTDGRTLRAAADLLERASLRPDVLYEKLNASYSPARLRLLGEMLQTLRFEAGGLVAVMELTKEMFARAGAVPADAEELVNEPMSTACVVASVLLTDLGEGVVRVNFRSKSPEAAGRSIDVAAVARRFGGGGHHRAAGARVAGTLAENRDSVAKAVVEAVEQSKAL